MRIKTKKGFRQTLSGKETCTYFSIVEEVKVRPGEWRTVTLANLPSGFSLPKECWPYLCDEIEGKPHPTLIPEVDEETAFRIRALALALRSLITRNRSLAAAARKPGRPSGQTAGEEAADILVRAGDIRAVSANTLGTEEVALQAAREIGLIESLTGGGLSLRTAIIVTAVVIARMAHPASERETLRWLRKLTALGQLIGFDFTKANEMTLHRAADALMEHKDAIEALLRARLSPWRGRRITFLYDLTNVHLEGQGKGNPKARRGHSKAKRSDCRLVTLAVSVDENGYIVGSRILEGNVSEPSTLPGMLEGIGMRDCDLVVMDKGISTKANLELMESSGRRYVVASRGSKAEFDARRAARFETDAGTVVRACRTVDPSGNFAMIWCHTDGRERKDLDIVGTRCARFEAEIGKLADGLSRPRTRKGIDRVHERIGRIKKAYGVARHFRITVVPCGDDPAKAASITCVRVGIPGSKAECPGVSCIRTNDLSLETGEAIRLCFCLTDVVSVFRCLKSELGLRPVYHSSERRTDAHVFIACLAYQLVNHIRLKLKAAGIRDGWETIRGNLETHKLVVLVAKANGLDADVLIAASTAPIAEAEAYYEALGMGRGPEIHEVKAVQRREWDGPLAANW
ncbi:MAG: transposase [Deltaproteobacteria bacterium]|jgi:hypothetical protein|nr:transposase [Deltaproteobacteria bacterium]